MTKAETQEWLLHYALMRIRMDAERYVQDFIHRLDDRSSPIVRRNPPPPSLTQREIGSDRASGSCVDSLLNASPGRHTRGHTIGVSTYGWRVFERQRKPKP